MNTGSILWKDHAGDYITGEFIKIGNDGVPQKMFLILRR
jgi:hypothetical protein